MYGTERGCLALVWPLAPHPTNRNEVIVWDLSPDPAELASLDAATLRQRLFSAGRRAARRHDAAADQDHPPEQLADRRRQPEDARRAARPSAGASTSTLALRHADAAARSRRCSPASGPRSTRGRRARARRRGRRRRGPVRRLPRRRRPPHACSGCARSRRKRSPQARPDFDDPRLDELLFRYRARNFPDTLRDDERARWEAHRAARLHDGAGGALTLEAFFERIDALGEKADERGQDILGALVDYATDIAPERD